MFIPSLPAATPLRALAGRATVSLDKTFGAILLGTFVGLMLYGITLHQAYRYHAMYPSDRLLLKTTVYTTVILETAHIALSCHTCYYYLVTSRADASMLQDPILSLQILPILTGLVIGISQAFFARRAYVFGKKYRRWVFLAIFFLVGEFGFCIGSTIIEIFLTKSGFTAFVPDTWIIATASAMAMCADGILTTVLIIALRRGHSGQKQTDSMLDMLVLYTITTGLLTSLSMVALLLCAVLRPKDLIYTAVSLVCTKMYANTLLAALNSRKSLRDKANIDQTGTELFSTRPLQSRSAFDRPVAIELPELPACLRDPCERRQFGVESKVVGESVYLEGATGDEARCSCGSASWEPNLHSVHDKQVS